MSPSAACWCGPERSAERAPPVASATLKLVARQPRRTMTGPVSAGVATPTPTSVPARILALQAHAGNRAVAGLLRVQRDDKRKAPTKLPGLVLGTNRAKQDVKVDHELGSPLGY